MLQNYIDENPQHERQYSQSRKAALNVRGDIAKRDMAAEKRKALSKTSREEPIRKPPSRS